MKHFTEKNDSVRIAFSHASLARYYLLQDKLKETELQIAQAKEYDNYDIKKDLAMSGYMELLQSILNYAKNKHINMMEWADFANSLQENAYVKQAITDAKEENNRLLTERNLKLTIKQQRTQIIFTYVGIGWWWLSEG